MEKVKVGIIGSGNIGCDLLVKVTQSPYLQCSLFMGRNLDSKGMQFAQKMGITVTNKSIQTLDENPFLCDIVFDATTASAHAKHFEILKKHGIYSIDLTPSLIGKMCVPVINGKECLKEPDVNMITCGGQATLPIVNAVCNIEKEIDYIEIAASISSNSAGPGTRANIDEFTQTTKLALKNFSNAANTKAIIILNPAEPPIMMHNTIYFSIKNPNMTAIEQAVKETEEKMRHYIKGYRVIKGPVLQNNILIVMVQVEGAGDYLPKYSGNLDIITSSAVKLAEMYAMEKKYGK